MGSCGRFISDLLFYDYGVGDGRVVEIKNFNLGLTTTTLQTL